MNVREVEKKITSALGCIVKEVRFSEREGCLVAENVPLMAMRAIENIVSPLGVYVVDDREYSLDVIINEGSLKCL